MFAGPILRHLRSPSLSDSADMAVAKNITIIINALANFISLFSLIISFDVINSPFSKK